MALPPRRGFRMILTYFSKSPICVPKSRTFQTQIASDPGHPLKQQEVAPYMKFLSGTCWVGVRDILAFGSLMLQKYPAPKLHRWVV